MFGARRVAGDRFLYELYSRTDELADGGADPEEIDLTQAYCPECARVKPEWKPRPINIILTDIDFPMITCPVKGTRMTHIFQRALVETLGQHFTDQIVGECYSELDGIPEYVTCYSMNEILVRGGKGEEYWICPTCGKPSRDKIRNPKNVLRSQLDERMVFQDFYQNMYFRQALIDEIDWSRFPDAELEKIRIVDRPLDGKRLPGDPDWDAM